MDSPVQKIKERLGIEEIVSSYIKLEQAGANLKAKCPFHNEKTPSFFVSPERSTYYCFGCGASGDIFTFVEEFEGLDFKGALKLLAERAGVELPRYNPVAESEKEKLYRAMEAAAKFFEKNLQANAEVQAYLQARGLNAESIKNFRVGFVPDAWRELYSHLKTLNFSDGEIEKAGLIKKTEKGFYDRFRGRIMFPIMDSGGRVIAFSGRIFGDPSTSSGQAASPKYLNSPETPLWSKNAALYGIDRAKGPIRKSNFSILVEGQMDLIMSHQAGYRNTVATSGTALSLGRSSMGEADSEFSKENAISNLGLVRRLSPNLVLAFDADEAGEKAAARAGKIALALGMDVKVAAMPEGQDPAELIREGGVEAWRGAIKNSQHIVEFVLQKILDKNQDQRKTGREIREKVLPFVAALPSSIEKAHFLKQISERSGIPETALQDDFKQIGERAKNEQVELQETEAVQDSLRRKDYIKRRLLGIVLWQMNLPEPSVDSAGILKELSDTFRVSTQELLSEARPETEDLIFEAEVFYTGGADVSKDAAEMIQNLKEEVLKEELASKMRELYLAEEAKDKAKSAQIFQECQDLNTRIQDIKNNRFPPKAEPPPVDKK